MKKKWIFIIAAGFGILSLPAIHGIILKPQYNQFIQIINQNNPDINLEIIEYQQGWLSSTALLQVSQAHTQTEEQRGGMQPQFVLQQNMTHGPVLWSQNKNRFIAAIARIKSHIQQHQEVTDAWINKLNAVTQLTSFIHYNNRTTHFLHIEPTTARLNDSTFAEWQGMHVTITTKTYPQQRIKLYLKAKIGEIQIQEVNQSKRYIEITPIELLFNASSIKANGFETKLLAKLAKLKVMQNQFPSVTLEDLNIQTETQKESNTDLKIKTLIQAKYADITAFFIKNLQNLSLYTQGNISANGQSIQSYQTNFNTNTAYGNVALSFSSNNTPQDIIQYLEMTMNKNLGNYLINNLTQQKSPINVTGYQALIQELFHKGYIKQNQQNYYLTFSKVGGKQYINNRLIQD